MFVNNLQSIVKNINRSKKYSNITISKTNSNSILQIQDFAELLLIFRVNIDDV
jgi:hypothetical protein